MTLSEKIWDAMQKQDIETLEPLIHEQAHFVHMGVTLNKEDELQVIKSKKIIYKHVAIESTQTTTINNLEIVLNKLTLTAIVNDQEVQNPFMVSEVYQDNLLVLMTFTKVNY